MREVIFKRDKEKELLKIINKNGEFLVREVKIVNEVKNRKDKVFDEKLGLKIEFNIFKIIID